jgi:hypothetical protein
MKPKPRRTKKSRRRTDWKKLYRKLQVKFGRKAAEWGSLKKCLEGNVAFHNGKRENAVQAFDVLAARIQRCKLAVGFEIHHPLCTVKSEAKQPSVKTCLEEISKL